jgi:hypothetical protein
MLFHTPTTSTDQEAVQEVRSGLGDALTYAPRACPVAAVGCSVAALAVYIFMWSVRDTRFCGYGALLLCIYTHSNQ